MVLGTVTALSKVWAVDLGLFPVKLGPLLPPDTSRAISLCLCWCVGQMTVRKSSPLYPSSLASPEVRLHTLGATGHAKHLACLCWGLWVLLGAPSPLAACSPVASVWVPFWTM